MSYLHEGCLDENNFPLFEAVKRQFGFIPNFYRAQTLRPDLIEAEAQLVNALLIKQGALARQQKEYIFLVCSAANLSTYCVTAHCEIVRMLGIQGIGGRHGRASLSRDQRFPTGRCRSRLPRNRVRARLTRPQLTASSTLGSTTPSGRRAAGRGSV